MTDTRLSLEYFERIEVNPRLTLLRVGGSPAPDESRLALVVSVDGEEIRTTPLGGSVSVEDNGRWRAAFPVPSDQLEGAELSYTLDTGETVELPEPAVRVLPNRAEEAALAPPDEPALAEEPVEELPVAAEEPVAAAEPEPAVVQEPAPAEPGGPDASGLAPAPRRGRRWWLLAVLALLVAVVIAIVVVVVASNGTDDNGATPSKSSGGGRSPAALQALPEAPNGVKAGLTPITAGRATLTVSGLPSGTYEAWLYNDILDAKPLATFHGPNATVSLKFPADVGHFEELDVSHEGDANPGHSGQSVLRVPLAGLTG
jgi:hypothetical protein